MGDTQPLWWACFAEDVRDPLAAADGAGLCRALGLGHLREGDWLLAWRYNVLVAKAFYRPTAVEARDSPYHHPSPPEARFGITMPLDGTLPSCRELLHLPLKGQTAVEGCTGKLLRVGSFAPTTEELLTELRRDHRQRLRQELPDAHTNDWLERHFPTP